MSTKYLNAAFMAQLEPKARSVLVALADYADDEGYCFPSMKTLCKKTGWSDRFIAKKIKELISEGIISKTERFWGNGGQTSNLYQINIKRLIELFPDEERAIFQAVNNANKNARCAVNSVRPTIHCDENTVRPPSEQCSPPLDPPYDPPGNFLYNTKEKEKLFDEFYKKHYPRKKAPRDAKAAWMKIKLTPTLYTEIIEAISKQKHEAELRRKYGLKVPDWPYPQGWLNGQRWLDTVEDEAAIQQQAEKKSYERHRPAPKKVHETPYDRFLRLQAERNQQSSDGPVYEHESKH